MNKIKIIKKTKASTNIDLDLVNLTEYITQKKFKGEWQGGGLLGGEYGYGVDYKNKVFSMKPYYWGECDCGWDEFYDKKEFTEKHSKDCFQTKLGKFENNLKKKGVDFMGKKWVDTVNKWAIENGHKSGWGGCAVYCDCGRDKKFEKWINELIKKFKGKSSKETHKDTCSLVLSNFKHYKSGLEIRWYKWIGRDMEYNKKISNKEWKKIYNECIKSIRCIK